MAKVNNVTIVRQLLSGVRDLASFFWGESVNSLLALHPSLVLEIKLRS